MAARATAALTNTDEFEFADVKKDQCHSVKGKKNTYTHTIIVAVSISSTLAGATTENKLGFYGRTSLPRSGP